MDLTSRQNIQLLLKKRGLRPLKRFGQNFLVDSSLPEKIAAAAQIEPQDTVLEIGPGIGAITRELAKGAKKVIAVEKDREMVNILQNTLKDFKNVEIVQGDILKLDIKYKIQDTKYKVVGNLPFYLTAPVIRKFLEMTEVQPQLMILVVQKEVGQRICAKPPKMSILANSVQFYANAEIVSYISKKSFWPEPQVDAAIIKITPKSSPVGNSKTFFKIMKAGFSQPRKQLVNNLAKKLNFKKEKAENWLTQNNIRPIQRAETLNIEDWLKLTKNYKII